MKNYNYFILIFLFILTYIVGINFGISINQENSEKRCQKLFKNELLPITYSQSEVEFIIFGETQK